LVRCDERNPGFVELGNEIREMGDGAPYPVYACRQNHAKPIGSSIPPHSLELRALGRRPRGIVNILRENRISVIQGIGSELKELVLRALILISSGYSSIEGDIQFEPSHCSIRVLALWRERILSTAFEYVK
jgi:hypothetical protein